MTKTTTALETIEARGSVFKFDRNAVQDKNGDIELSQLRDDEILVYPGLIYRRLP